MEEEKHQECWYKPENRCFDITKCLRAEKHQANVGGLKCSGPLPATASVISEARPPLPEEIWHIAQDRKEWRISWPTAVQADSR